MFCSVQTNDLFVTCNSQTDRLLDDEECKRNCDASPGEYSDHTEQLNAQLSKSATVEQTNGMFASAICSSYAAVLTSAVGEETNCDGAPDTIHEVYCNRADRVVDVELVIEEPNAEAYQEAGNQTDDSSAKAVSISAGSGDSNQTSQ